MNFLSSWLSKINIWGRALAANEELFQLSPLKRAYVGLMICFFKSGMGEPLSGMLDSPSKFPPSEYLVMWEILLELGFKTDDKLKMYQKIGMPPSDTVQAHVKLCDIARQVMMSTVGAGFTRSAVPSVMASWKLLLDARPFSSSALSEIRGLSGHLRSIYGEEEAFILDDEAWLKLVDEIPAFMKA